MAKLTLTDLGTTLSNTAANTINNNSALIEVAMEKTLSRDGTSPNQMEADLDLNGHDITNVDDLNAQRLFLQGSEVLPLDLVNTGEFATNEQGARADTALQPSAIGSTVQAFDTDLTAIAALVTAADRLPYSTGAGTWSLATFTAAGRALLDDVDNVAQRTTLGLGTAAVANTGDFATAGQGALAASALQPADIGVTVQGYDLDLAAIAALSSVADRLPYSTGVNTWALTPFTLAGRALVDDADATAQRATLGLVIGTNVQAFDTDLTAIAALVSAADQLPYATGAGTWALTPLTAQARTFNALTALTGTYTPTLTNTTNIAASTPFVCQWMRVNNVVTVSGKVDIDVTATGNALLGLSLPVASALTLDTQLGGTFTSNAAATPETGCIFADATNDRASFKFIAVNTANNTFFFSFTYLVL